VTIIILCLKRYDLLARCLESVASSVGDTVEYEVVIVLNGSEAEVRPWLESTVTGVRVVSSSANRGFGGGNNLGASVARGQYLVFLNDDTEVQPEWLDWLVRTADDRADAGAVGSRLLFADGIVQEAGQVVWSDGSSAAVGRGSRDRDGRYAYLREVDYCSASSLLVRRSTWDRVGGFDEAYFPAYYEDIDLCMTIRDIGETILYEPRSLVVHHEATHTSDEFRAFLFRRNGRLFREKWARRLARCELPAPTSAAGVARAVHRARGFPRRVLVVDDRVPTAIGSGFGRMYEAVEELASTNAVTLLARERTGDDLSQLQGLGIDVVFGELADHIADPEVLYEAVVLSRPFRLEIEIEALRRFQPQAAFIYDCEALAHRRLERQQVLARDDAEQERIGAEIQQLRRIEQRIPHEFDRVVAVTEEEAAILRSLNPACKMDIVSTWTPLELASEAPAQSRNGAVFVAGWLAGPQAPNADALRWFVREILPLVRARSPSFTLRVTGPNPPRELHSLESDGLEFVGFVPDIAALYASVRVAVAPMRLGAGISIKTLEALRHGVPVVATRVAAEGLGLEAASELRPTDDPVEFADRLVALTTSVDAWEEARGQVLELLKARTHPAPRSWIDVIEEADRERTPELVALHARH
jgi:GT2 family glycosyltransferase